MSSEAASITARPDHADDLDHGDGQGKTTSDRADVATAAPATARRLSRRRALAAAGVVTVALIAGGGLVAVNGQGGQDDTGGGAGTTSPLPTVAVERRTLEEHADLDGTLGYVDIDDVTLATEGTITALAALGTVVDRGETLVEVDRRPVPLLFGERPMWRALGPSVADDVDVEQLEANLVALGVATPAELTVDQNWTRATTNAVQDWQESRGLDRTGAVALGDIVFLPGAVRVAEHPAPVGGAASGSVLGVTSTSQLVMLDLEANRRSLVEPGKAVVVVLPDTTEVAGTVYAVGDVATSDSSDGDEGSGDGGDAPKATIDVVIAIDDPAALTAAAFDQAPVTVRVVTSAAVDVVAVPVEALLVLAEGGYAVELVHDDGTTSLVAVELGAFADGWVEVTGDVAEGDQVEVPQ
jgi:Putative peptidoglycan binding domain